uniref:Rapid ALkalinization Factor n=1 Tax=Nelumbo nucifera TaxID=4432 RepID=A0A822XUY2_NELNU|nr:TPA_asm: hypothetical protein HUJ06_025600 [Nelumbo nucifera]
MEMSKVKVCFLLVILINMAWMNEQVNGAWLDLDPCKGPHPPPHCAEAADPKSDAHEVTRFDRGCSERDRCRK